MQKADQRVDDQNDFNGHCFRMIVQHDRKKHGRTQECHHRTCKLTQEKLDIGDPPRLRQSVWPVPRTPYPVPREALPSICF